MNKTNIILTGLRGSGKTTIGQIIAKKLGWDFIDMDKKIEQEEGVKIKDIVEVRGWEYFRAKEADLSKKLAQLKKTIISTGGGTIIDRDNEKALKKTGRIIYLYVKPKICAKRILNDLSRPPLTNKESVEEEIKLLYKQRNHRYCESANLIFEGSGDIELDAQDIIEKLGLRNLKKNLRQMTKKLKS